MATDTLTNSERLIIQNLRDTVPIRFSGNGFNHGSVTPAGTFAPGRKDEYNGWYTQRNNALMPQEAVESVIAKGLVEVVITPVGGILVNENTLKLTLVGQTI